MDISELNIGQGNVEVTGTIKEIGEIRKFNKFGRDLSVGNAVLQDDSGTIKLSLWNDDTSRFKKGDKIKIINGYVNEFQGEKQLTSGKYGSIEKLESSDDQQIISESSENSTNNSDEEDDPEELEEEIEEETF